MKTFILLIACLFSLELMAETQFSPIQREAVRYVIEDSQGHFDGEMFVEFLRSSHILTKKELKKFPEVIAHPDYEYVLVHIDDCVDDMAIVIVDKNGEALNALYIDSREHALVTQ
jgi:hypothetical protein